jgi:hypothetical protein
LAPHGDCANAVGAALAQISGETDQIYREMSRKAAIAAAEAQAVDRAVVAGAERASVQIVDIEDMPIAYLPGNALRVRARRRSDARPIRLTSNSKHPALPQKAAARAGLEMEEPAVGVAADSLGGRTAPIFTGLQDTVTRTAPISCAYPRSSAATILSANWIVTPVKASPIAYGMSLMSFPSAKWLSQSQFWAFADVS